MDCKGFGKWLENRDLSDISESDRALKHSRLCSECRDLAGKDEALDRAIAAGMAPEPLPEHLERMVLLNLGSASVSSRRYSTGIIKLASLCAGIAVLALVFLFLPSDRSAREEFGRALAVDHREIEVYHPLEQPADIAGWLRRNVGFSASLPADFDISDLQFVGLRTCLIGDCRTVHLVFRDGGRLISLYIAPVDQVPVALKDKKTYSFTALDEAVTLWRVQRQVYALVT